MSTRERGKGKICSGYGKGEVGRWEFKAHVKRGKGRCAVDSGKEKRESWEWTLVRGKGKLGLDTGKGDGEAGSGHVKGGGVRCSGREEGVLVEDVQLTREKRRGKDGSGGSGGGRGAVYMGNGRKGGMSLDMEMVKGGGGESV